MTQILNEYKNIQEAQSACDRLNHSDYKLTRHETQRPTYRVRNGANSIYIEGTYHLMSNREFKRRHKIKSQNAL